MTHRTRKPREQPTWADIANVLFDCVAAGKSETEAKRIVREKLFADSQENPGGAKP